jgi:hypothetical protein
MTFTRRYNLDSTAKAKEELVAARAELVAARAELAEVETLIERRTVELRKVGLVRSKYTRPCVHANFPQNITWLFFDDFYR